MIIFFLLFMIALASMGYAAYSAAPWVPTRQSDVRRILRLARLEPGERIVDLGCGDGRLLFAAALEFGAEGVGVEMGIPQYLHALVKRLFFPKRNAVKIIWGDLYRFDLSTADVVIVYLLSKSYDRLKEKFQKELKKGARVVVQAWSIPGWKPVRVDKPSAKEVALYLYTV